MQELPVLSILTLVSKSFRLTCDIKAGILLF